MSVPPERLHSKYNGLSSFVAYRLHVERLFSSLHICANNTMLAGLKGC